MSKPNIKLAESMLGTRDHAVAMNTIAAADRRKVELHDELVAAMRGTLFSLESVIALGQLPKVAVEELVKYADVARAALAKAEAIK